MITKQSKISVQHPVVEYRQIVGPILLVVKVYGTGPEARISSWTEEFHPTFVVQPMSLSLTEINEYLSDAEKRLSESASRTALNGAFNPVELK